MTIGIGCPAWGRRSKALLELSEDVHHHLPGKFGPGVQRTEQWTPLCSVVNPPTSLNLGAKVEDIGPLPGWVGC